MAQSSDKIRTPAPALIARRLRTAAGIGIWMMVAGPWEDGRAFLWRVRGFPLILRFMELNRRNSNCSYVTLLPIRKFNATAFATSIALACAIARL